MPKSIVQTLLGIWQALCFDHFPVPNHPLVEEPFPDIQPEPPLIQLYAVPLGPITGQQRAEISQCLSLCSPPEEAVGCHEALPSVSYSLG